MTNLINNPTSLAQWLTYIEALHPKSIEMGLERVSDVANRLQISPKFPIISIAGTNGKGSTCGMLENVYVQAGYRVGAYVSPHFVRYNERVRVNQQDIDDDALCRAFEAVEAAREEVVLTYFEMGTLAAMYHFLQSDLDVAILEVGMGGRLDAVNVFEPVCAIVTSIDLDHMDYLCDTREKIGMEKAGIYRKDTLAICGEPDTPNSVLTYAEEVGADLQLINRDFSVRTHQDGWQYQTDDVALTLAPLALQGDVQMNNAACVINAVQGLQALLPVSQQVLVKGISSVSLLGRFYTVREQPQLILDVAHNPQAAKSLAKNLQKTPCAGRTLGVMAMLADKDIAHVVTALASEIDVWYLADTHNPRGASAEQLAGYLQTQVENGLTHSFSGVDLALDAACKEANKNDRIIVFGSFYTVADAVEFLRE